MVGKKQRAFTLIELLVVIAIISILAGMLMTGIVLVKQRAKIGMARSEMKHLAAAISQYEGAYSRLPGIIPAPPFPAGSDVTYGLTNGLAGSVPSNTVVMLILMAIDTAPPFPFSNDVNPHHAKNPQRSTYFDPKMVSGTDSPGLSTVDYQFRDPWGNPYVITLDMNSDGKCDDALYKLDAVSAPGSYGLSNPSGTQNKWELSGPVMIWSLGPDGKADGTQNAKSGVNKDNVLGWQ